MPNPLRPQPGQQDAPPQAPGLLDWFGDPQNRAALMGFGAQMLQPVGAGQSQLGHVGESISAGGEAARGVAKQDLAQQEADSREQLRAAQATAAESRAGAAGERALRAGDIAELRQQELERRKTNDVVSGYMRHQHAVKEQNDSIQKQNKANADARLLGTTKKEDVPADQPLLTPKSFEEFATSYPGFSAPKPAAPAAAPTTVPSPGPLRQATRDELANARAAIQRGADAAAVKARLQKYGIDPSGL